MLLFYNTMSLLCDLCDVQFKIPFQLRRWNDQHLHETLDRIEMSTLSSPTGAVVVAAVVAAEEAARHKRRLSRAERNAKRKALRLNIKVNHISYVLGAIGVVFLLSFVPIAMLVAGVQRTGPTPFVAVLMTPLLMTVVKDALNFYVIYLSFSMN